MVVSEEFHNTKTLSSSKTSLNILTIQGLRVLKAKSTFDSLTSESFDHQSTGSHTNETPENMSECMSVNHRIDATTSVSSAESLNQKYVSSRLVTEHNAQRR
ncbi:hypothetical protein KQX54_017612 [Cotesia glomerata]|uniref:Uncharacterized protein n=1 Tax=Cotesia glomerata TaxID=32391 RepID=A0AAV7IBH2_COTGL|nr:hypothetical protein KQX54_017612 [Cotesia glomerata]